MTDTDWSARARREAAAILAYAERHELNVIGVANYNWLVTMLAAAWIQGANYGAHEGIEAMGDAFHELKAELR